MREGAAQRTAAIRVLAPYPLKWPAVLDQYGVRDVALQLAESIHLRLDVRRDQVREEVLEPAQARQAVGVDRQRHSTGSTGSGRLLTGVEC